MKKLLMTFLLGLYLSIPSLAFGKECKPIGGVVEQFITASAGEHLDTIAGPRAQDFINKYVEEPEGLVVDSLIVIRSPRISEYVIIGVKGGCFVGWMAVPPHIYNLLKGQES